MTDERLSVGPFEFERSGRALLRSGRPVDIGQRGIALLKVLAAARGEVVTKAELMQLVWPGLVVEEGNLAVQVAALRKALGPCPDGGEWIVTVPRVGYRLSPATIEPRTPMLPSLAVLPFQNLSDDPGQEYFADGIVEDIITAFSRFKTFAVIARNSSFVYKGRAVDVREAARALGVRYVLEGSVRRAGQKVRVSAQLIEGESGAHLWAENFDGTLEDVLDFQDRITDSVIGLVEPKIRQAELERARRKRLENLDAYDLYLQTLPSMQGGHYRRPTEYDDAIALMHRAIALDPGFAPVLAMAAWAHERRLTRGLPAPPGADDAAEAISLAERAVAADPDDAIVLAIAGVLQVTIRNDNETGLALVRRAAVLNPNSLTVANIAGYAFFHSGDFDRSIVHYERGMRLSPLGSDAVWSLNGITRSHLSAGRFEEALSWGRRTVFIYPEAVASHCHIAASCAQLGRIEEARSVTQAMRERWPRLTILELLGSIGQPASRDRFLAEGLRLAGLPEA